MSTKDTIEQKLVAGIDSLQHLEVINESDRHNVPPGSESHFKLVLVADAFEQLGLLDRHRLVNELLSGELAEGVHALAIHAYTPEEWKMRTGGAPMSPPCLGGGEKKTGATH